MKGGCGKRVKLKIQRQKNRLRGEENGNPARVLYLLASALAGRAIAENTYPAEQTILVIPGGRAALLAYKQQRDPSLAERMQAYRVIKYRLWRALSEVPILTRETFEEQIASDPVERAKGQLMMF